MDSLIQDDTAPLHKTNISLTKFRGASEKWVINVSQKYYISENNVKSYEINVKYKFRSNIILNLDQIIVL